MKSNFTASRLQVVLAAFALILATSVTTYAVMAHNEASRLANQAAQRQSKEATITRLFGPDGKNVHQASVTADMMEKSISDRLHQVVEQCNKKNVSNKERGVLLHGTYEAGKEASDKVVASYYQAPFEPHYPPLPQ